MFTVWTRREQERDKWIKEAGLTMNRECNLWFCSAGFSCL